MFKKSRKTPHIDLPWGKPPKKSRKKKVAAIGVGSVIAAGVASALGKKNNP